MKLKRTYILLTIAMGFGLWSMHGESFKDVEDEGSKAIESGDYEKAYTLAYPFAVKGDPDAQFTVALLSGWVLHALLWNSGP